MRLRPKRHAHRVGPIRFNRSGVRLTSITLDLGVASLVLWSAPRRSNRKV